MTETPEQARRRRWVSALFDEIGPAQLTRGDMYAAMEAEAAHHTAEVARLRAALVTIRGATRDNNGPQHRRFFRIADDALTPTGDTDGG